MIDRRIKSAVLTIIIATAIFMSAIGVSGESTGKLPEYKELHLLMKVKDMVRKNYVKDVSDKDLLQGAINGMLQSLDAHSSFMTPDMFKELQEDTKGEFEGLGIEITLEDGVLTIISPIEDTPGFRAGLKPSDKIIRIDGETTKNITLVKAVKMMRGPKGSKVTLTIVRQGFKKFKDYSIIRDVIHVHSVKKQVIETRICIH